MLDFSLPKTDTISGDFPKRSNARDNEEHLQVRWLSMISLNMYTGHNNTGYSNTQQSAARKLPAFEAVSTCLLQWEFQLTDYLRRIFLTKLRAAAIYAFQSGGQPRKCRPIDPIRQSDKCLWKEGVSRQFGDVVTKRDWKWRWWR